MSNDIHYSEDELEEYALGRLNDADVAVIEAHLLICEECRASLTRVQAFIRLMKAIVAERIKRKA